MSVVMKGLSTDTLASKQQLPALTNACGLHGPQQAHPEVCKTAKRQAGGPGGQGMFLFKS